MPERDLAMENERQNDQTDEEQKGQSLSRSDSFHIFLNTVTVSVPAHRSASLFRLSQDKFSAWREWLRERRSSGTQACHVSAV